jgi:hypothetical protein
MELLIEYLISQILLVDKMNTPENFKYNSQVLMFV